METSKRSLFVPFYSPWAAVLAVIVCSSLAGVTHQDVVDRRSPLATDIHRVEYFIDTDPGEGNGVLFGLFEDSISYWVYHPAYLIVGLSYGEHVMYVRYQDGLSRWSGPKGKKFYVGSKKEIVSAEEFIDHDPGQGLAQSKFVPDTTDTYSWAPHVHNETYGQHIFYSRFQTEDGYWGHARPCRLNISPGTTFVGSEYFVGDDPGQGNGVYRDVSDGGFEMAHYTAGDLTLASAGKQPFRFRYLMSGGHWSVPAERPLNVLPVSSSGLMHLGSGELFVDSDPGIGLAQPMIPEDGAFDELEERAMATVSTHGYSSGIHSVCLRMRDASSTWTRTMCGLTAFPIRAVIQPLATGNPLLPDARLSWEADSLATEYRVHSDSSATGSFTSYFTVNAPDTSTTFGAISARQFYYVLPHAPAGLFHSIPNSEATKGSSVQKREDN